MNPSMYASNDLCRMWLHDNSFEGPTDVEVETSPSGSDDTVIVGGLDNSHEG